MLHKRNHQQLQNITRRQFSKRSDTYDIQIGISCASAWLARNAGLNEAHATLFEFFFSDLQDSYVVTKSSHE